MKKIILFLITIFMINISYGVNINIEKGLLTTFNEIWGNDEIINNQKKKEDQKIILKCKNQKILNKYGIKLKSKDICNKDVNIYKINIVIFGPGEDAFFYNSIIENIEKNYKSIRYKNVIANNLISNKYSIINGLSIIYNYKKWFNFDPYSPYIIIMKGNIKSFKIIGLYNIKD